MDDKEILVGEEENDFNSEPTELLTRKQFLQYDSLEHDVKADLLWAYKALGATGLKPEDAPSPGAWFIYTATKDNDLARKSFITGPLTKLLPTRAQMEKLDRAEDGRKCFDLIERLLWESDEDAPVLSDVEKRAVKDSTRQLELQTTGS